MHVDREVLFVKLEASLALVQGDIVDLCRKIVRSGTIVFCQIVCTMLFINLEAELARLYGRLCS